MSNRKSFSDMPQTLRATAAAGMDSKIVLKPESAIVLAEILEEEEKRRMACLVDAIAQAAEK